MHKILCRAEDEEREPDAANHVEWKSWESGRG